MQVIVPLAGPDFERADGSVKSEFPVDGQPLLRRALESRPWWQKGLVRAQDLIFVLHDSPLSRAFAEEKIRLWYPGSRSAYISEYTRGAALSTACGLSMVPLSEEPLIIDLCDILFDAGTEALEALARTPDLGALAITFPSDAPKYSYLECDENGDVLRSREKIVISGNASAGVYIFRSAAVYLRALAHSFDHRNTLSHNDLLYACPLYNGVVDQGLKVRCIPANNVRDIHVSLDPTH